MSPPTRARAACHHSRPRFYSSPSLCPHSCHLLCARVCAHGLARRCADAMTHAQRWADASEALELGTDESYNLTLAAPRASLRAATVYGALRGLETLSQLAAGGVANATEVHDWPRFDFRATMIDTSRHFYPVDTILQHLDVMSYF